MTKHIGIFGLFALAILVVAAGYFLTRETLPVPESSVPSSQAPQDARQDRAGVTRLEFWDWNVQENYRDWRSRVDASSRDPYPILAKYLNDKDPAVRAKAVNVVYNLRQVPPKEILDKVIRLLKEDPSDEVVDRACVVCMSYKLQAFKPALLDRLSAMVPEHPDRLFRLVDALEALDARDALPLIEKKGRTSPFLARFRAKDVNPPVFPKASLGEYVNISVGHSPMISGRKGPPCPLCKRPLSEIIRLTHPLGPKDPGSKEGIPFYRCLVCVMHSPLFVKLGPPEKVLGEPDGDLYDPVDIRHEDKGERWAVRWDAMIHVEAPIFGNRLGGEPVWIQHDETPTCPSCGGKMQFSCQLDSNPSTVHFVEFGGVNYFFWCGKCRVTSSLFQE